MTNHILKNDSKILRCILSKLDEMQQFDQLLTQYLEPSLAERCQVVKFDKNCLFVIVENGNWSTQLRFQIPDLITKLREHPALNNLNGIICKIRPKQPLFKSSTRSRTMHPLSLNTQQIILTIAHTIKDSTLRNILERIALQKNHVSKAKIGRT